MLRAVPGRWAQCRCAAGCCSVLVTDTSALSPGLSGYKDAGLGISESVALRPQWCCHCKVVILGSGVRKSVRDLAFVSKVLGCSLPDLLCPGRCPSPVSRGAR